MKNVKIQILSILSAVVLSFMLTKVAAADNRILSCTNKSGNITFEICGVRGCPAVVSLPNKTPVRYNLKRVKNSDGSLAYNARAGTKPSCNIKISALRFGLRKITQISCATKLNKSNCAFIVPGSSSSSLSLSSDSSSSSATSSKVSSSKASSKKSSSSSSSLSSSSSSS